ncbi:MAG: hypothetical protein NC822_02060 [Candidatus Omnitrophica bacterium]|nr:hypothetical protein [Candidatus Omnitrophota bacterium]MCM8826468.1 hypothetical protein [Candidatus Omnitrophota bacterium]
MKRVLKMEIRDIRTNESAKLKYVNPAEVVPKLTKIIALAVQSNLPDKVKNLRTNILRKHRERWISALFCYGMSKMLKTTVYVASY